MATNTIDRSAYVSVRMSKLKEWRDRYSTGDISGQYFYRLVSDVVRDAEEYSSAQGLDPSAFGAFGLLLERVATIVENIMLAINRYGDIDSGKAQRWRHLERPIQAIIDGKVPEMDRPAIEGVVEDYLDLPFRSRRLDHLLVDLLIALELYAFGREKRPVLLLLSPQKWWLARFRSVLFWGGVSLAAAAATSAGLISEEALVVTLFVAAALFLVSLALAVIGQFMPNRAAQLVRAMNRVYMEMNSDGPISAVNIQEHVKRAADQGVIWPPPLYVMLDDVLARGGRL